MSTARIIDALPLSFYAGVTIGALAALVVFVSTLFTLAIWIMSRIGG